MNLVAFRTIQIDGLSIFYREAGAMKKFAYTFDHFAEIMDHFTEALRISGYILYMQDYGGPVGFRMALAHPERVEALIVQDAVAHNGGLGENWNTRRAFWADRSANESEVPHGTKILVIDMTTLQILQTIQPSKQESVVDFALHNDGVNLTLAANWGKDWQISKIPIAHGN